MFYKPKDCCTLKIMFQSEWRKCDIFIDTIAHFSFCTKTFYPKKKSFGTKEMYLIRLILQWRCCPNYEMDLTTSAISQLMSQLNRDKGYHHGFCSIKWWWILNRTQFSWPLSLDKLSLYTLTKDMIVFHIYCERINLNNCIDIQNAVIQFLNHKESVYIKNYGQ